MALAQPLPKGAHRLYLRPARLRIGPEAQAVPNRLQMRVDTVEYLGDSWRYHLTAGGLSLVADHHADLGFGPGADVTLGWEAAAMRVFSFGFVATSSANKRAARPPPCSTPTTTNGRS